MGKILAVCDVDKDPWHESSWDQPGATTQVTGGNREVMHCESLSSSPRPPLNPRRLANVELGEEGGFRGRSEPPILEI